MQKLLRPVFCLLVEDNPLVGLDLADALDAGGYYVAGPFPCGREASEWLERFTPDVAIVDLTLRDGRCHDVIRELQVRAVPFIIYSGCPVRHRPFDVPPDVPWLEKPASAEMITGALQELLAVAMPDSKQSPVRDQRTGCENPNQKSGAAIVQEVADEAYRIKDCYGQLERSVQPGAQL
jgi:DNA-binding NtrC family response regulator